MDNEEAKFILKAYRASGADAGDARFAEALEQAKRDPELGRWLEREQALDKAVATKMRAVMPPAGLREAILAGGKMSARAEQQRERSWWSQPRWMALAASVVLMLGVAGVSWPRFAAADEAKRFGAFAMNDLIEAANHDAHGPGMGQLAAIVSDAKRRLGGALPIEFDALKANGCRTVRYDGRDVLEVCFERGGKEFHLYVMKRPENAWMRVGAEAVQIVDAGRDGVMSAVWSDERHVYALAGAEGVGALRAVL
ncbi:hypothetical protein CMV30_02520 [Nibricoccus aquaticus]|uniref:Uncharacterized protein n=1 Tax=Nibricoccus aquaticus TaxID=2576891 RepID=A0A290Q334_9BACT|nr:DUF3379 family protein [Nibricoccus aquaticus]ATC62924.1 hypothetical protein CMV30_02520 [Nibricoccus aquaticus]